MPMSSRLAYIGRGLTFPFRPPASADQMEALSIMGLAVRSTKTTSQGLEKRLYLLLIVLRRCLVAMLNLPPSCSGLPVKAGVWH